MKELTHIGADGRARMVDVSAKALSARTAVAAGKISLRKQTADLVRKNAIAKGDVITVAKIAGIQAAKQTAHLIPLCHPLPISEVKLDIDILSDSAEVRCTARTVAQTGVEMEALTAVAVAGLALHDMVKAVDPAAVLDAVRVERKAGGKTGLWTRPATEPAP
jgi:cyclic pyranopterin phosphate synthase